MTTKNWTLKSIANELGVSNATVSNAFNRPDQLSEKRRNEILAACSKLGYFGPTRRRNPYAEANLIPSRWYCPIVLNIWCPILSPVSL